MKLLTLKETRENVSNENKQYKHEKTKNCMTLKENVSKFNEFLFPKNPIKAILVSSFIVLLILIIAAMEDNVKAALFFYYPILTQMIIFGALLVLASFLNLASGWTNFFAVLFAGILLIIISLGLQVIGLFYTLAILSGILMWTYPILKFIPRVKDLFTDRTIVATLIVVFVFTLFAGKATPPIKIPETLNHEEIYKNCKEVTWGLDFKSYGNPTQEVEVKGTFEDAEKFAKQKHSELQKQNGVKYEFPPDYCVMYVPKNIAIKHGDMENALAAEKKEELDKETRNRKN